VNVFQQEREGFRMYCRNCKTEIAEQAVMCVNCGVPPKSGTKFCQNCGSETDPNAEICVKLVREVANGKDWLTALLLAIFLGGLGIHRFYVGKTGTGILQLLTAGGLGIWALIDIILIATGSFKDVNGNPLARMR
jgi:hypothetical protein